MRVYLACTVRGNRDALAVVREVRQRLERHGHTILTAHLLDDDVERAEARLTEREVFLRDLEWLTSCDALVAEASGSTFGVGFELGYVLARAPQSGQRVYLLYDAARRHAISRLIAGNVDPHCATCGYGSLDEVARFIDHYFGNGGPDGSPG